MIGEQRTGVYCVDLGESFVEEFSEYVRYCYGLLFKFSFFKRILAIQTHIYLQNLASIQPRTSPVKFARSDGLPAWRRQAGEAATHRPESGSSVLLAATGVAASEAWGFLRRH